MDSYVSLLMDVVNTQKPWALVSGGGFQGGTQPRIPISRSNPNRCFFLFRLTTAHSSAELNLTDLQSIHDSSSCNICAPLCWPLRSAHFAPTGGPRSAWEDSAGPSCPIGRQQLEICRLALQCLKFPLGSLGSAPLPWVLILFLA